jgi:hypothetical protein
MKTKLLAVLALATGSLFAATHVSVGVGFGGVGVGYGYNAPAPVAYIPECPGPGYTWVDGYWYYNGPQRFWHAGYWAPPVVRVAPYGYGFGYSRGFDRDRFERRDFDRDRFVRRDFDRGRVENRGNERGFRR